MANRNPCQRILIFRPGSIGDTVVSLPTLHTLQESYPEAEIRLLSNVPVSSSTVSPFELLRGSGLVTQQYLYEPGKSKPGKKFAVLREVRAWKPDLTVYLGPERDPLSLLFLRGFLKFLGGELVGLPPQKLRTLEDGSTEREASRLFRSVFPTRPQALDSPALWSLSLNGVNSTFDQLHERYLCISIGTKHRENDWGRDNWSSFVHWLYDHLDSSVQLVALGAATDRAYSNSVLQAWDGPGLNFCGDLSIRESAAVLSGAEAFLGHDSGLMHVAAAVETRALVLFSARNPVGKWDPPGKQHILIYPENRSAGIASLSFSKVQEHARVFFGLEKTQV